MVLPLLEGFRLLLARIDHGTLNAGNDLALEMALGLQPNPRRGGEFRPDASGKFMNDSQPMAGCGAFYDPACTCRLASATIYPPLVSPGGKQARLPGPGKSGGCQSCRGAPWNAGAWGSHRSSRGIRKSSSVRGTIPPVRIIVKTSPHAAESIESGKRE